MLHFYKISAMISSNEVTVLFLFPHVCILCIQRGPTQAEVARFVPMLDSGKWVNLTLLLFCDTGTGELLLHQKKKKSILAEANQGLDT